MGSLELEVDTSLAGGKHGFSLCSIFSDILTIAKKKQTYQCDIFIRGSPNNFNFAVKVAEPATAACVPAFRMWFTIFLQHILLFIGTALETSRN